jgi:hypothetical protein
MRIRSAILATFLIAPASLLGPVPAMASDTPTPTTATSVQDESGPAAAVAACCAPIPVSISYKAINISYTANRENPGGPVASCTATNSTCALTVTESVSTQIATKLGYSKAGVAADLTFTLNRTVAAAATCTSPRLKAGQKYVAYRTGRQAMYKIQKKTVNPAAGTVEYETSGWLFSWEPYKGAHIDCFVIN